jgi:(1->4)-alpha-D-glucan 1-alpha-D-glucosylmutase
MRAEALGSTYRLQLHGLGLAGARRLVPYLALLGIETVYLSPILAAVPGSTHGYDVIDPEHLDAALGSEDDFRSLIHDLDARDMRVLLDIVPNHMAADLSNPWWSDVLRRGQASRYADFFDIDWSRHGGRVLLPILGRPLAEVMGTGSVASNGVLELDGQRFPVADGTGSGVLAAVLARQNFRPAYWRTATTEGNYRRFFDIAGLVGVRVEDPEVFDRTHELTLSLCRDTRVAGVRVDHVDGLLDPARYLERLRGSLRDRGREDAVIIVEKVLGTDEALDPRWPVTGTTGYEFVECVIGLFLDEQGCRRLATIGAGMTGESACFSELAVCAKREELERSFAADRDRLARLSLHALDLEQPGHDLAERDLQRAWTELTVQLDVYRTYEDGGQLSVDDRRRLVRAGSVPQQEVETGRALRLLVDALLHRTASGGPWLAIARRWQQLSGAVMAKGVEDTATYRYPGLVAQADVGGDPDHPSSTVARFHRLCRRHAAGLNATSTHDSKRNEDARCRLAVVSESSDSWASLTERWHRRFVSGDGGGPQAGEELVVYQSMLALWPANGDKLDGPTLRRVQDSMIKASREAKRRSSWDDPDASYERSVRAFVARINNDERFRNELTRYFRRIAPAVVTNTLTLLAVKSCAPGTPDFYQGTELPEPFLTDPDNRRPVDFELRAAMLSRLPPVSATAAGQLLASWHDGRLKLYATRALLQARRASRELFASGAYRPLEASTPHVVAFARRLGPRVVLCVVPRLTYALAGPGRFAVGTRVWGSETVSVPSWGRGQYEDVLTGRPVEARSGALELSDALRTLPVAVLEPLASH